MITTTIVQGKGDGKQEHSGQEYEQQSQDVENEMKSHVGYLKSFSTSAMALGREITTTRSPSSI